MARRYSTAEKAKWTSTTFAPVRRAPIPIPATNNSALIEQNKLSLIRRVTNSAAQNTRALMFQKAEFGSSLMDSDPLKDILKSVSPQEKSRKLNWNTRSLRSIASHAPHSLTSKINACPDSLKLKALWVSINRELLRSSLKEEELMIGK
ncbi:hypothetical protein F2Q68_00017822 [Brassica cretica]|uniref:Uncharacterized protein n=1 Tax=Brassica cretica TaxID=69181 RepID=A0A8S9H9S4_BRACR|nr:hypothetical protein F2Q68_00017822 [Brassica cretica]